MAKTFWILTGLLSLNLAAGCAEQAARSGGDATVYRHHFVGWGAISGSTNGTKLKEVAALPGSQQLREHILQKLAAGPRQLLEKQLPTNAVDNAALFRPLFDDLLSAESYVEVRGPANKRETVIAVQVNDDRARTWHTNLSRALTT